MADPGPEDLGAGCPEYLKPRSLQPGAVVSFQPANLNTMKLSISNSNNSPSLAALTTSSSTFDPSHLNPLNV